MKPIFIIAILALHASARITVENCNGIVIHNIKYEEEILKSNLDSPYQLTIDYDTNALFFSYSVIDENKAFESAYINLKTNEFHIIEGIAGGFASAVDEKQGVVYLGGRDGIYTFDYKTNYATRINSTKDNIWQMFFKNDLYYSKYPGEEVYVLKDNKAERVPELIDTKGLIVAIDNFDNIYFSNSTGLFVYKKIKKYISYIGEYNLNGITKDITGKLFFSTPDGLYYIEDSNKTVIKLTSLSNVYGIAIDISGNIIYSTNTSVVRLRPTKTHCYSNDKEKV